MWLRCTDPYHSIADTLKNFSDHGIAAQVSQYLPGAIVLQKPLDVSQLPGFDQGKLSVQDLSGQFCVSLMDLQPGLAVLDACAAPGGKAAAILDHQPGVSMLALEIDQDRMPRLVQNMQRLGLTQKLRIKLADATRPENWWDGKAFDRILLDTPCSGSGVIRRHPDIKILRKPQDMHSLVARQAELLERLWQLLTPGGNLLYCTCSVFHAENAAQISAFLTRHRDARELAITAPWGRPQIAGVQILPGDGDMDGFYYASLQKIC